MSVTCNGWMRPKPDPIRPHEPIPSGIPARRLLREWHDRNRRWLYCWTVVTDRLMGAVGVLIGTHYAERHFR